MTTLSNHVPDPRLITAFAERRDGPLHQVNPWTKVGIIGALVLAVTVFDRLALLAGLYGTVLIVYGLAELPYRRLVGWYTLPMLFIVSVAGPLAFFEPGTPIGGALSTPLGNISVTWAGLVLFFELSCRSLTVVTFALTASMTTKYTDVAYMLGRLLPRPIDQVALLTYRFTFVMLETLEDLVKAALSRGANFSEFWSNKRLYARILGMTMLSAIEQSERLVKSMEARGYDGDIVLYGDVSRPPIHELFVVAGSYVAVVGYALIAVYEVGL
ncbi:Transmembrane component NikQ of energizing module of nickel ECF transporter [Halorubrum sp. DM2]|uniref:energy-coupling factor transporter transmembrane component T family protein n=1 Tax=Halorubrum TaxID=56688 RepID=UPI000677BA4B|nr:MULTISPECIES: energy-coupling factor transporter transmembrane component T [Halorubrum]VTT85162.1 Transmembrane component NikQ of energizing module of nickel ECF transporter [Halorubrum sp. DM2]